MLLIDISVKSLTRILQNIRRHSTSCFLVSFQSYAHMNKIPHRFFKLISMIVIIRELLLTCLLVKHYDVEIPLIPLFKLKYM